MKIPSSFRDPSGWVFQEDGRIFRRINAAGMPDWDRFIQSGLAEKLLDGKAVIPFREISRENDSLTLELEKLPFISYPYEWSFSQLRDAGLLTLGIMRKALKHDMMLKDASAFNIAFRNGRPVFMDHTSFTVYRENEPWPAYRQYVMHFLAPLLLMREVDLRCLSLFESDIGGIPLDLASRLLPRRTYFNFNTLIHIHLHAAFDHRYSSDVRSRKLPEMPRNRLENLIRSLEDFTGSLKIPGQSTQWEEYYEKNSYSEASFRFKKVRTAKICRELMPGVTLDLGANSGVFSEIASQYSGQVIACDIDPQAVEQLYRLNREKIPNLQPVLLDLNNPTPDVGVFNEERQSFFARSRADLVLGLALIHHLRISGNWTLDRIVRLFSSNAPHALVEFVPLDDIQVKRLIRGRESIFTDWTLDNMTAAFRKEYQRVETVGIPGCTRTLIELHKE